MTLRVTAKVRGESVDKKEVARLLGCESDQDKFRHWSLNAPDREEADLDAQVEWILSRVTSDLEIWKKVAADYRLDIFCALYLERWNRGTALTAKTMTALGARGIELGLDIYYPEEEPNKSPEATPGQRSPESPSPFSGAPQL